MNGHYGPELYGGAGAGNPGGSRYGTGGNGTGGVIILIVHGKLKLGISGSIKSNGTSGSAGERDDDTWAGSGGGSGGRFHQYIL